MLQGLVPDPVRLIGTVAEAPMAICLVIRIVSLKPRHLAITLEGEDMGGDAIQKPAIVRDDDRTAGKIQ